MESPTKTKWQQRLFLVVAGFIIAGLLLLIAAIEIQSVFWASLFNQLSTALLISGLWSGVYELFLRRDFLRANEESTNRVLGLLSTADKEKRVGLVEAALNVDEYDSTQLFLESKVLFIVQNEGRTWVSLNAERLRKRFADPNKRTIVFLLHADSPALPVFAKSRKYYAEDSPRNRIIETINILNQLKSAETQLEIYGHPFFNPYSLAMNEEYAVMSPYYIVDNKQPRPLLRFDNIGDDCFYRRLIVDIEILMKASERIL